jgi:hypothetical protein
MRPIIGIVCFFIGHLPLSFDNNAAELVIAGPVNGNQTEFQFCYCIRCKTVYIKNRNG